MSGQIVLHCAPVLAGIKTGNLFSFLFEDREKLLEDMRKINHQLASKGIRIMPLAFDGNRVLLYVFRPDSLQEDLNRNEAAELLNEFGYKAHSYNRCLSLLRSRLRKNKEFPHEIGLFLSYPPEDVKGFIENHASNCKLLGYWKVYGDEKKARELFARYKRCTETYCRRWKQGIKLDALAVAI